MASVDLSGNARTNPYNWEFFSRDYVEDPLAINLTTGHTMLTFNSPKLKEYLESKKPYTKDFLEGQLFILQKITDFLKSIYETGHQPYPKYLLKSLEMLTDELIFEMERVELLRK